jgi:DNA (cytosine-5)-methyltransferase 1
VSAAPTFIDLFCGCGGFSLGMERAGFRCLAAIDFNEEAVATFRANFADVPHVLEKDLTRFAPRQLASLIVRIARTCTCTRQPSQRASARRAR